MKVVCIEEDYFSPVKIGEIYTVTDIIEAGSPDETYNIERKTSRWRRRNFGLL